MLSSKKSIKAPSRWAVRLPDMRTERTGCTGRTLHITIELAEEPAGDDSVNYVGLVWLWTCLLGVRDVWNVRNVRDVRHR